MSIITLVQRVATFPFEEPTYEQLIEMSVELLQYLKFNKQEEDTQQYRTLRNTYWELIMRIAFANNFSKK